MMNLYTNTTTRGERGTYSNSSNGNHHHHQQQQQQQPGSSMNNSRSSTDGLKFGEKIYFEDHVAAAAAAASADSSSSFSSSAAGKKAKGSTPTTGGGSGGLLPPRCQVEGCNVDLSDAKAYYSRHKVCATHSKSPQVIVAGIDQRFCQQCSRFHQLPEFDQGKRSCRRRLAGHNERRRKPPPGSSLTSRYGRSPSSLLDNSGNGGLLMDFSAPASLSGRDPWATARSASRVRGNRQSNVTGRWFGLSEYPPPDHLMHNSAAGPGFPSPGIPPGSQCFSSDTSCALSLLSNQPWSSSTRIRAAASSPRVSNFISPEGVTIALSSPQDSPMDQLSTPFWGFKGDEATTSTPVTGQFSRELELPQHAGRQYLELEDSTGYGSSSQHMDWSQ